MKKIKITITQEIEVPDECSVVECAGGKRIKYGSLYLAPEIEYMQSYKHSDNAMHFEELDENMVDFIAEALVFEKEDINEI